MARPTFDWDRYLASATFHEVHANSPDLSSRRPPSLYNPDRTLLYLPSVDLDVVTDDYEELKRMLELVIENFRQHTGSQADRKRGIARIDFVELSGLLQQCAPDSEPFTDPDALLLMPASP